MVFRGRLSIEIRDGELESPTSPTIQTLALVSTLLSLLLSNDFRTTDIALLLRWKLECN